MTTEKTPACAFPGFNPTEKVARRPSSIHLWSLTVRGDSSPPSASITRSGKGLVAKIRKSALISRVSGNFPSVSKILDGTTLSGGGISPWTEIRSTRRGSQGSGTLTSPEKAPRGGSETNSIGYR